MFHAGSTTAGLSFREAGEVDFEVVVDLATQLATHIEEAAPPLTLANFVGFYLAPAAPMRLLLAEMEGRVVGLISWTLTHELYSAERRVYISDLSVDRTTRGRGGGHRACGAGDGMGARSWSFEVGVGGMASQCRGEGVLREAGCLGRSRGDSLRTGADGWAALSSSSAIPSRFR